MAARAKQSVTQVGGDPRVVAHPGFREIPKALFTLQTEEAKREYDTLARLLYDAGKLTVDAHRSLSSYAMQFDVITRSSADGKPIRAAAFIQLDKARAALRLDEIDKPVAAPEGTKANKFARAGFASRGR